MNIAASVLQSEKQTKGCTLATLESEHLEWRSAEGNPCHSFRLCPKCDISKTTLNLVELRCAASILKQSLATHDGSLNWISGVTQQSVSLAQWMKWKMYVSLNVCLALDI